MTTGVSSRPARMRVGVPMGAPKRRNHRNRRQDLQDEDVFGQQAQCIRLNQVQYLLHPGSGRYRSKDQASIVANRNDPDRYYHRPRITRSSLSLGAAPVRNIPVNGCEHGMRLLPRRCASGSDTNRPRESRFVAPENSEICSEFAPSPGARPHANKLTQGVSVRGTEVG